MNVRALLLAEYQRQRSIPFDWKEANCLDFAGDCARLITGRDPVAHLRGRCTSEVGMRRIGVNEGWKDLGDAARSIFPSIPMAEAQNGDWALIKNGDAPETIGVVIGAQVMARSEAGIGIVPLTKAAEAFRVS